MVKISQKSLEAKRRHHYVWAKYLAQWGCGTNNVYYTTKNGKFAHDSVRAIAVESDFYQVTELDGNHIDFIEGLSRQSPDYLHYLHMSYLQDALDIQKIENACLKYDMRSKEIKMLIYARKCNFLENLHTAHEREALPVLAALVDERLDVLQDKQKMLDYMIFFGHQISRTKTFRDSIVGALSFRGGVEVGDTIAHSWWFLSYMLGMNMGFSFYIDRNNARHALLLNNSNIPFITSDQPIVNVHACVSELELASPDYGDFYYPLSPRVAYVICDSSRFKSGKNEVNESTVMELNEKTAAQALVHIIGDSEKAIRPYKKHIGRRHQRV